MKRLTLTHALALSLVVVFSGSAAHAISDGKQITNIITIPSAAIPVAEQTVSMKKKDHWYSWLNPMHYVRKSSVQQQDLQLPQEEENQ
jgi:hypothetical protein